jgi:tRNA modification GTPase
LRGQGSKELLGTLHPMYNTHDTIAAAGSAGGGAARGIVRLSGPQALDVLRGCFRPTNAHLLATVRSPTVVGGTIEVVAHTRLYLPADVYLWPHARSYTREPLVEIHTIGSAPLVAAVVATLCAGGARPAEPGEFTLRAFLAGRIDLTEAEAVLGVIDASGEAELQTALAQLAGGLARPLEALRGQLLDLLAELEAGLDFVEEDIAFVSRGQIATALDDAGIAVARLESQLAGRIRHDLLRRVVLVGQPNVGKSSLLNALVASNAAIVAGQPGTTRDYVAATLEHGGARCELVDTAGIGPLAGDDPIGAMAQQVSAEQQEQCDVRLLCLDGTRPLSEWEHRELAANPREPQIVVLTKCDLPRGAAPPCPAMETSAVTGRGLASLREAIARAVRSIDLSTTVGSTAERCRESVRLAGESLARASELNRTGEGEELVASEIRLALTELGKMAGAVHTDDVLDRVFSRFCIGK